MVYQNGDYWKQDGTWFAMAPNGLLANLSKHRVEEHEDGTITVRPSILVTLGRPPLARYHGFLERGKWRTLPDSTPIEEVP